MFINLGIYLALYNEGICVKTPRRETNIKVGEDGDIRIMKKTAFDI